MPSPGRKWPFRGRSRTGERAAPNEGNNVGPQPIQVELAAYSDLVVSAVEAPAVVLVGDPVRFTMPWTVKNQGTGAGIVDDWLDRVILSSDAVLGSADDRTVDDFAESGAIDPGQERRLARSVQLPGGLLGSFHYKHPAPLDDARRAVRLARWKAKEWGLDPGRVGVLGFSAGGHLASTVATQFREAHPLPGDPINGFSERPDVAILVYPVISFTAEFSHKGSARNLLGPGATKEQLAEMSSETRVTAKTPPTFLAHTLADNGVPMENSLAFATPLRRHKVPFELHVFEKGQHGLGLGKGSKRHNVAPEPSLEAWPVLCATWLKARGFLDRR